MLIWILDLGPWLLDPYFDNTFFFLDAEEVKIPIKSNFRPNFFDKLNNLSSPVVLVNENAAIV